ncbi:hypothetical protein KIW84_050544 [Lathyrus oleraceus]|uniref:Uncharacterized protein n=1 Tax=Pisum sativum TaxID=3888 RepID=A0A9D5A9I0_PEA|nr:hypothetical protein KIW84_050544 [Pisum sativum]
MAPSRKDKGKYKIDEASSEPQEAEQHAPSLNTRRLTFDFMNRSLMSVKYVKEFYANIVILPGDNDVITSKVKNRYIIMDLEAFGICLGIPFVGQAFHHGLVPEWDSFSKMDYFFHTCRVSQQAILGKKNPASSRLLLFANNLAGDLGNPNS